MNTLLSDSARKIDRYGMEYVDLKDCRAIEERLNECVEALEGMLKVVKEVPQLNHQMYDQLGIRAHKAIANARRKLP